MMLDDQLYSSTVISLMAKLSQSRKQRGELIAATGTQARGSLLIFRI